jgi:hypothetical protein
VCCGYVFGGGCVATCLVVVVWLRVWCMCVQAVAYPSLKPLAAWTSDLVARLQFIQSWVDHKPAAFWIAGLFFPQAFLTGTLQVHASWVRLPGVALVWDSHHSGHGCGLLPRLCAAVRPSTLSPSPVPTTVRVCVGCMVLCSYQNFARRHRLPVDTISFACVVRDDVGAVEDVKEPPAEGCYIHGLFLEGARWDR